MGGTKKIRRKYQAPAHMWQRARIEEETAIQKEYGMKNKTEIWKVASLVHKFKNITKNSIASRSKQSEIEGVQLMNRLKSIGLMNDASVLSDVLMLSTKDLMERRLQTITFRMGLARSIKQARQFITHGHIKVAGKKISSPAYIVKKVEESLITFAPTSSLADKEHPERTIKAPSAAKVAREKAQAVARENQKKEGFRGRNDKRGGPRQQRQQRRSDK
jgi:small subunit ribosomal protein S4